MRTNHHAVRAVFLGAVMAALAGGVVRSQAGSSTGFKTVIVMGDSRTDGCEGEKKISDCRQHDVGFDRKVLTQLVRLAAKPRPAAVFFTGDLTLGLEREEIAGVVDPGDAPATGGWARDFEYDSKTFERMMRAFRTSVTATLNATPSIPSSATTTPSGPTRWICFGTSSRSNTPPEGFDEPSHLAYVVPVGTATFFVIATDYYVTCDLDDAETSAKARVPLDQCTGGTKIKDTSRDTSFFHYPSLRIPDDPTRVAVATVRDCRDRMRATIPLTR